MKTKICVVGLGYVGLPLAVEFAKEFDTLGFDVDKDKVGELKEGVDKMNEVSSAELKKSKLEYSDDPKVLGECDFIIVAVPTPIDKDFRPDLTFVKSASKIVGENISEGSIVVFESTVFPGTTEEICVPIIEKASRLKCGDGFKVGYSPERVNPGDKEHTIDKITKIVSGMDEDSLKKISDVYGKIIKAGVFKAKDIKTAEAAKVIENIQRDLNIALMNELSVIFSKMGINTLDVVEAAGTKWNFHKYHPGLVGGHCIGVDPYYLTYKAKELGYESKLILAGRSVNEFMSKQVVNLLEEALEEKGKELKGAKVLVLGLTFKENVNDPRNSKAKDVIKHLKKADAEITACDPLLEDKEVQKIFGVDNTALDAIGNVDAVVLITPHKQFRKLTLKDIKEKIDKPVLIDVRSVFDREEALELGFAYKTL